MRLTRSWSRTCVVGDFQGSNLSRRPDNDLRSWDHCSKAEARKTPALMTETRAAERQKGLVRSPSSQTFAWAQVIRSPTKTEDGKAETANDAQCGQGTRALPVVRGGAWRGGAVRQSVWAARGRVEGQTARRLRWGSRPVGADPRLAASEQMFMHVIPEV